MKTLSILFIIFMCFSLSIKAQDATAKLNEAESSYSSHDLDNARYALQEALNEINQAIGKEILDKLPKQLKDISYNEKEDNVTGAAGFAGLFVNRSYGTTDGKNGKIEIMSDSPLLASINAILSMPMIMGMGSQGNDKRIKIKGYKAILKKETSGENNSVISYEIQVPLNSTLLTFKVTGFPEENDAIAMANSLPIEDIAKVAQ